LGRGLLLPQPPRFGISALVLLPLLSLLATQQFEELKRDPEAVWRSNSYWASALD